MPFYAPPGGEGGGETPVLDPVVRESFEWSSTVPVDADALFESFATLGRSFNLGRVTANKAVRVRLYSAYSFLEDDILRPIEEIPEDNSGVVCDLVLEADVPFYLSPVVVSMNFDGAENVSMMVTNLDTTGVLNITFDHVKTEDVE